MVGGCHLFNSKKQICVCSLVFTFVAHHSKPRLRWYRFGSGPIYIYLFIFILTAQILTADLWSAKKFDKYNSTYDTGFLSSHGMFPFFSTLCMHDFHSLCDFTIGGTHVENRHCVSPWIQAPEGFRHSRTGRVHISFQQCKYKQS